MKSIFRIMLILAFALALVWSPQAVKAQAPVCDGTVASGCIPDGTTSVAPQVGAYLNPVLNISLKGGYVAEGVGMRNRGFGTIKISGVPANSTITAAYLFWAVIGPSYKPGFYYYKGNFNGRPIVGSLIGSSANPCWGSSPIWSYRAIVKPYIYKGANGTYSLSGFASGRSDAQDPWAAEAETTEPLVEGASLVIVYANAGLPYSRVEIYNGAHTAIGGDLHQTLAGMNAATMPALAYTTFIGADGQSSSSKPGGSFFDMVLPSVAWNGSDPNGNGSRSFTYGSLWDTMTADLTDLVEPPELDFWLKTQAGGDCLTWVAQAAAYRGGNRDIDGDRLLDHTEMFGYNNGFGFVDLPAMGANYAHKDLFVEADYMLNGSEDHLPNIAQLDDTVAVFNAAPVANPDGTKGIHIHIDTGGAAHFEGAGTYARFNLGGGNSQPNIPNLGAVDGSGNYDWTAFQNLKNTYFDPARYGSFHYMIFADNLPVAFGGSSGISRNGSPDSVFIQGATDFIVSMGTYWGPAATSTAREGTFIHELGHNLGLRHGGNDHVNYKPNYLSIMSYTFQISGLYRSGSWGKFDYSRFLAPTLNEAHLNEVSGLGALAATYGTKWFYPNGAEQFDSTAGSNIDWNKNGSYQTNVAADINHDGSLTSLGNQNNWASMTFFGGGGIGAGVGLQAQAVEPLMITTNVDELTLEEYLKHNPLQPGQ